MITLFQSAVDKICISAFHMNICLLSRSETAPNFNDDTLSSFDWFGLLTLPYEPTFKVNSIHLRTNDIHILKSTMTNIFHQIWWTKQVH